MRAGTLNSRVTIQQLTDGKDEIGQPVSTWTTLDPVWANISYQSGIEAIRADAQTSIAKVIIQIRKRAGVTAGMQIVDADGVTYKINTVLPDKQRRDRINLACEVVA